MPVSWRPGLNIGSGTADKEVKETEATDGDASLSPVATPAGISQSGLCQLLNPASAARALAGVLMAVRALLYR